MKELREIVNLAEYAKISPFQGNGFGVMLIGVMAWESSQKDIWDPLYATLFHP